MTGVGMSHGACNRDYLKSKMPCYTASKKLRQSRDPGPSSNTINMCYAGESSSASAQQRNTNSRRDLLATVATLTAVVNASSPLDRAEAFPFGLFEPKGPKLPPNVVLDRTLSYTFTYPLQTASGREIPIVASRKPEKYSSAAPLVADARQRIVAEYVSLADGITCAMFVGPVTGALQRIDHADWTASGVAKVVLSDRSAVRHSL